MKKLINKIKNFCNKKAIAAKTAIQSVSGEGYVDTVGTGVFFGLLRVDPA